jgi:predicted ABC-type ATPase
VSKRLIIIAGPNGAGKTTFARDYLGDYPGFFLSADDLALKISPKQPELAKIEAGRQFSKGLDESIRSGRNLVIESTLSGRSLQRVLHRAREAGYTIAISFIFLESPQACISRVRERVQKGGHDVPERDILRRFFRSKENFWRIYKEEAGFWMLFYNSGSVFQQVAFGDTEGAVIVDEGLFGIFHGDVDSHG